MLRASVNWNNVPHHTTSGETILCHLASGCNPGRSPNWTAIHLPHHLFLSPSDHHSPYLNLRSSASGCIGDPVLLSTSLFSPWAGNRLFQLSHGKRLPDSGQHPPLGASLHLSQPTASQNPTPRDPSLSQIPFSRPQTVRAHPLTSLPDVVAQAKAAVFFAAHHSDNGDHALPEQRHPSPGRLAQAERTWYASHNARWTFVIKWLLIPPTCREQGYTMSKRPDIRPLPIRRPRLHL